MPPTPENDFHAEPDGMASNPSSVVTPVPVMVHVVAPATLPAGYTFEAQLGPSPDAYDDEPDASKNLAEAEGGEGGSRTFTVTVPEGGVKEGDTFLAPLPKLFDSGVDYKRIEAPTGRWKDGLFACGTYGWCHPALCCALCCTQIAMGQVMQRVRLTWLGHPASTTPSRWYSIRNTFKIVCIIVVAYTIYSTALEIAAMPPPDYDPTVDGAYYYVPPVVPYLRTVGSLIFTIWSLYALIKTRESVRATYSIPAHEKCAKCPIVEDFCCSAFCSCCVTAQMLRHTGEYERYEGRCCSATGHPVGTPAVV